MADQSHRDEMNAAIRAQRERQAVPRSIAGADEPPEPELAPELEPEPEPELEVAAAPEPEPEPEQAARKGFWARLLGR
jgi:hypothetical protein